MKGINQQRKSFFNQDELPSGRLIGNSIQEYESRQSKLRDRFSILKFLGDKLIQRAKPVKEVNYGGIMYGQVLAHDFGSRHTHQVYGKKKHFTPNCQPVKPKHNKSALTFFR